MFNKNAGFCKGRLGSGPENTEKLSLLVTLRTAQKRWENRSTSPRDRVIALQPDDAAPLTPPLSPLRGGEGVFTLSRRERVGVRGAHDACFQRRRRVSQSAVFGDGPPLRVKTPGRNQRLRMARELADRLASCLEGGTRSPQPMLFLVSSGVGPVATQPGRSGEYAE